MYGYFPNYLDSSAADPLLSWLVRDVSWQQERIRLFGQERLVPRLVSWFGDAGLNYIYAGTPHLAQGWPPALADLRKRLATQFAAPFNFVLLNRYRDGTDSMGWHKDDEKGVGDLVASLSLGGARRFRLEHDNGKRESLVLDHGSLLLMSGRVPHALPKTRRPVAERVNLSFRVLAEPSSRRWAAG